MNIKFESRIFLLIIFISAALNALLWIILWNKFPPSDVPYAIRYSILSGADIFGTKSNLLEFPTNNLWILPLTGLTIIILNTAIAFLLRKKELFLSYIFLALSFIVQLFLFVALFGLLKFNGQI